MTETIPSLSKSSRPAPPPAAPRRATVLLAALAAALTPAIASAQIADAWLRDTAISTDPSPYSSRLEGMGDLSVAVEDAGARIDIYDVSGNPAALFANRDTSVVEQYSRYDRSREKYFGFHRSAQQRRSGARVIVRQGNDWSLGIDVMYRQFLSSQHDLFPGPDDGRFIRDFDLPYPGDILGVFGDRAIGARVDAPLLSGTFSRPLFVRGLTVGVRFGYLNESESRDVPVRYPLDNSMNSYQLEGGAVYDLARGPLRATLGGNAGWASDKVTGTSSGPLNQDRYDWERPSVWFGGQAAVRYGDWMRGIFDFRHQSFDGEMVARVNWAPQFYLNPLPSEYQEYNLFKRTWSALLSGQRRNEVGTRLLVDVRGTPLHVGADWRYHREFEWFRPNPYVLTIGRDLDVLRLGYKVGAGLSADLPDGRGVVAVETHYSRDRRVDFTGALPTIVPEGISYHFGAEYRPAYWLPVRAGLVALRNDPDRLRGDPHVRGTRFTAGIGYEWAWLRTHIDLAWAREHWGSVPAGVLAEEVRTGDTVSLVARHGF